MMSGRKKKKTILEERIRYKEYYIVSECDQCDIQDKLFAPITTNTYIKSLNYYLFQLLLKCLLPTQVL